MLFIYADVRLIMVTCCNMLLRVQRQDFFDKPESGGFFKCGVFEQNGGTHDMSRALGNARNSVTLQSLGGIVRMSTGANALQLMGKGFEIK